QRRPARDYRATLRIPCGKAQPRAGFKRARYKPRGYTTQNAPGNRPPGRCLRAGLATSVQTPELPAPPVPLPMVPLELEDVVVEACDCFAPSTWCTPSLRAPSAASLATCLAFSAIDVGVSPRSSAS